MDHEPYDFDTVIDRHNTDSYKWDSVHGPHPDLLPLWVADMDFASPPEVRRALEERARHPVYGYPIYSVAFREAVCAWMSGRHGWEVDPGWIVPGPGVVSAVHTAMQAFTQPGDRVILQTPAYYPFLSLIPAADRIVALNPLTRDPGGYVMDLDHLRRLAAEGARMAVLVSPHNPVGRVWRPEELQAFAEICLEHSMIIVSDEIHHDIVLAGHHHTPLAALSPEIADITVTCTSAGKTFNLAGLTTGNTIISNRKLRRRFRKVQTAAGLSMGNIFGMIATQTAYATGAAWLDTLLAYLAENYRFLTAFLSHRIPEIRPADLQGTYLAWLDCTALGLPDAALTRLLREKAGVRLNEGRIFGPGGEGFQRMNIACPRLILAEALGRMEEALYAA